MAISINTNVIQSQMYAQQGTQIERSPRPESRKVIESTVARASNTTAQKGAETTVSPSPSARASKAEVYSLKEVPGAKSPFNLQNETKGRLINATA